jgi:hypothetical protein
MTAEDPEQLTCPSGTCSPGHLLIGIVGSDGTSVGVRPPLQVDDQFVATATAASGRAPRSSGPLRRAVRDVALPALDRAALPPR